MGGYKQIEILILQAQAFDLGGESDRVLTILGRATTLPEPEGHTRIFVDEGPPMVKLLYEALAKGISPDYIRYLLSVFPDVEEWQNETTKSQAPESEWIEPLSERELDVLQLIAEGLTNQEVSTRLYLSLNTIKAHTRNIYGKLSVNNRTQAVARARSLGILDAG